MHQKRAKRSQKRFRGSRIADYVKETGRLIKGFVNLKTSGSTRRMGNFAKRPWLRLHQIHGQNAVVNTSPQHCWLRDCSVSATYKASRVNFTFQVWI